jgi:hypothetical protein
MSGIKELLDIFGKFARSVKHRHEFIDSKCEFCQIDIKECQHGEKNVNSVAYTDDIITKKCICGHSREKTCIHEYISSRDDENGYYDYCEICGFVLG